MKVISLWCLAEVPTNKNDIRFAINFMCKGRSEQSKDWYIFAINSMQKINREKQTNRKKETEKERMQKKKSIKR